MKTTAAPQTPAQDAAATPDAAGRRIIKKYPNRRLYDTESSSYITLAQVRALVMQRQPFVVHDVKTGQDLTRSILLQIILEAESGGSPMFSEAALANLIRFYGNAMQGFMGSYLERNVQAFMEWQNRLAELGQQAHVPWSPFMPAPPGPSPQQTMAEYLEQTNKALLHLQQQAQEHMRRQAEQAWSLLGGRR